MTRSFSLAGLLRLRRIQEDTAAAAFAGATARVRETDDRRADALERLDGTTSEVQDAASLRAIAAARASSRSMLLELEGLAAVRRAEAEERESDYTVARTRAVTLEKLEHRHDEAALAAELHHEQVGLDEIASTAWHRRNDGNDRHNGRDGRREATA